MNTTTPTADKLSSPLSDDLTREIVEDIFGHLEWAGSHAEKVRQLRKTDEPAADVIALAVENFILNYGTELINEIKLCVADELTWQLEMTWELDSSEEAGD